MKYERLTEWISGIPAIKTDTGSYIAPFAANVSDAIKRLAELEDKIENGTLIELPCKVGDNIFYVSEYGIEEFVVSAIRYVKTKYDNWELNSIEFEDKETGERRFDYHCYFNWIGRSVFFTREEAEKKLKELQE